MNLIFKSAIVAVTLFALSACVRPEISCTVKLPQKPKSGGVPTGSTVGGIEVYGTIKSNDTSLVPDAAAVTIDVSGSSTNLSSTGHATLTIKNMSDTVLASKTFTWNRSGNTISFSDPTSVNNWLIQSGASVSTSKIDYSLYDVSATAVEGVNTISVSVNIYSQSVGSASSSFTGCSQVPHVNCMVW